MVKTLVDRAKQVAMVKGLNKNLLLIRSPYFPTVSSDSAYQAAMDTPSHRICFRIAECSRVCTDWPDSEMVINACAFTRSTRK